MSSSAEGEQPDACVTQVPTAPLTETAMLHTPYLRYVHEVVVTFQGQRLLFRLKKQETIEYLRQGTAAGQKQALGASVP